MTVKIWTFNPNSVSTQEGSQSSFKRSLKPSPQSSVGFQSSEGSDSSDSLGNLESILHPEPHKKLFSQLGFDDDNLGLNSKTLILSKVLVGGCFDVLHFGHIKFLQAAKNLGNFLSVALESDEKILQAKKRSPLHIQEQRAEVLSHLRLVDEIILLPYMTSYEEYLALVQYLRPDYLAVTAGDPQWHNKEKQAKTISAKIVSVVEDIPHFSSSHLIREKDWI